MGVGTGTQATFLLPHITCLASFAITLSHRVPCFVFILLFIMLIAIPITILYIHP